LREHQTLQRELKVALIVHKPVAPETLCEQLDRLLGARAAPKLPPELEAEMDKLHAEYARELPAKLAELQQAVRRARAHPLDEKLRQAARTLAHRLAGTAGSYGFPDESSAAAVIEAQAIAAATAKPAELDMHWSLAESTVTDALAVRLGK
jgi:HPt (histidine-containing phosphotransfer) domain-containing protein